ncbi:MAG: hypothetical protein KZQ83_19685 [gamma proteobacterium symbiont of Taylorina sp.]|nr:hypothetical protein [gamma proteobacterium symbiont of Taylorina sp.]
MSDFFIVYMLCWGTACIIALVMMFLFRSQLELFQRAYWQGLFQTWKVISFLIALSGIILIAPYTGDPTWDYYDAAFMAVLTYTTAPWVISTLYRTLFTKRLFINAYIAICLWMFSASWSYDLYLVLRDGFYPGTWLVNIYASSILYILAGLMWNLEYVNGTGMIFSFMNPLWPSVAGTKNFAKIFWFALPFMLLVSAMIIFFLL